MVLPASKLKGEACGVCNRINICDVLGNGTHGGGRPAIKKLLSFTPVSERYLKSVPSTKYITIDDEDGIRTHACKAQWISTTVLIKQSTNQSHCCIAKTI